MQAERPWTDGAHAWALGFFCASRRGSATARVGRASYWLTKDRVRLLYGLLGEELPAD